MQIHQNHVKARLSNNEVALGMAVQLGSPDIVEIAGLAGYDFVWVDCEHGTYGLDDAVNMMRAADASGTSPIVRVPTHSERDIMRMLDDGAKGVIVPNVSNAHEASAIVAAAKYQTERFPGGRRGACPRIRAAGHQAVDWSTFANWSNDNTSVWLLVESIEGADKIDEIAAVTGVDAITLGPFDLSVSMGYPGNPSHPKVHDKLIEMTKAVRAASVDVVGVLMGMDLHQQQDEYQFWISQGCRIINVTSDRRLIGAMKSAAQALRRTTLVTAVA